MIRNLGQVAAIYVGKTAPRNVNMIWLDNTVIPYVFKSYNGEEWIEIPTGMWVETYVNGWLVSLQQGTVTADDDYLLINSGGVNYKMTVRDFVKSSVGNPLDFKGVIRTDSDFPNPSTLEGGDMYIIITNPTGGTVTDPYSGKTFSDSEKIVWDSVINSWASLGKIDVKVDLSTTYSATEVTIHSSAGKETTVVGVTDDNAGVMVPVQKKWLDSLSDGSTLTPQGSSTAPYHKHRYSDIVDRIISQQVTGDSAINPMSQKATTEALNLKLDKSSVLQVSGVSTTDVMSQKAVTDVIQTLKSNVDDKLSRYLPLSGGTMTGTIKLATNNVHIEGLGQDGTTTYHILSLDATNRPTFGSSNVGVVIRTKIENILHEKDSGIFIVHDTSNLRDPAKLSADQTFTGTNNFTAGKFNVAGNKSKFSVNDVGGLRMYYDYADDDAGISRYIDFYTKTSSDTDYTRRGVLGLYASKSTPNSDYAYIGAGDVGSEDAQYRFYPNTLYIPETFYLSTLSSRRQLIGVDNINNRAQFGGPLIPTWIISNNTDLFHSKYTNQSTHSEYKIWDESNLPSPASTTDLSKYALLAGDNTFTGSNTFNKTVSVVGSGTISLNPSTGINFKLVSTSAARGYSITLGTDDDPHTTTFGSVLANSEYAYIALPGTDYGSTPYRFLIDQMTVPNVFRLLTKEGVLLLRKDSDGVQLGSGSSNTFVNSFNSDLTHRKYTASSTYTDYKIWDASNLPSPASSTDLANYLPLSGGEMSGNIVLDNSVVISGKEMDGTVSPIVFMSGSNILTIGSTANKNTILQTGAYDLLHNRAGTRYKFYDSYNLPNPVQTSDLADYVVKSDLDAYATKVELGDYATKEWSNNQFPSKTGTGASGTWGISISGNATTATDSTKLGGVAASLYATQQWVTDNFSGGGSGADLLPANNTWTGTNTYTRNVVLANDVKLISSKVDGTLVNLIQEDSSNNLIIGNGSPVRIYGEGNLVHYIGSSAYTIYDSSNLIDPATKQWVDEQGYITIDVLNGYATEEWVEGKNYLTSSSLDGYAKTTDLASYLPLAGGTLTGDLLLSNNKFIKGILSTGTSIQILGLNSSNTILIGNGSYNLQLYTGATDISHWKGGTSYKIWDASNISKPVSYNEGTEGSVTAIYNRNLGVNGSQWTFLSYTNASTTNIYAPTTAGTSGQILQSQGAGKAPIWVDGGTGGGVQLSDTNVWTGLNTFQGGLKTSDGTNSYDVWDNNSLKYPVKYAINSTGTGYALSFYSKTAGWKEIDTLTTKYLTSATVRSISAGGDGYIGIGTNAYASAAISKINTNSIYFRGLNNTVLSTNDDGKLEYGSSSNYAGFNSGNIRIAYPIVSSSGGGGGGGGGTTDPSEGGLTISYYPANTNSRVTERAKIYCTTTNLYLKDLAKNIQLDFDTDGLYVTTGSTSKVRLATLNDISGSGSGVSLDGNNTWTGVNIFSGTGLVTNQYDSGNAEIPATANYSIRLACGGSYDNYGFGAVRSEDRVKQSHAFVQTPSAFFTFDNSGSLYTTIGNTKYEFWNKQNLAKPIVYNTNSDGDGVLYKGDSTANRIDSLELVGILPPTNDAVTLSNGGTGGFGNVDNAYAEAYIGNVHANNVTTATIVVPGSENYFEFKEDGLHFYDMVNQEEYKINMTKV